jgi:hypothetical protein
MAAPSGIVGRNIELPKGFEPLLRRLRAPLFLQAKPLRGRGFALRFEFTGELSGWNMPHSYPERASALQRFSL